MPRMDIQEDLEGHWPRSRQRARRRSGESRRPGARPFGARTAWRAAREGSNGGMVRRGEKRGVTGSGKGTQEDRRAGDEARGWSQSWDGTSLNSRRQRQRQRQRMQMPRSRRIVPWAECRNGVRQWPSPAGSNPQRGPQAWSPGARAWAVRRWGAKLFSPQSAAAGEGGGGRQSRDQC